MNKRQLQKNIGKLFKIRPTAVSRGPKLTKLVDDEWRLDSGPKKSFTITNIRTDHVVLIDADNIWEFRNPQFLMLRCQVILEGQKVLLEPISGPLDKHWMMTNELNSDPVTHSILQQLGGLSGPRLPRLVIRYMVPQYESNGFEIVRTDDGEECVFVGKVSDGTIQEQVLMAKCN